MADVNYTKPTGDIKVFIDKFNIEFDKKTKELSKNQENLKNIYNDAISISKPRTSTWPKDENVKTIGDLFKYTFPDITTSTFVEPPEYVISTGYSNYIDNAKMSDYISWEKDFNTTPDIKEKFYNIKKGLNRNNRLENYNSIKKPGITNPSLYSPGQYYFDVFMEEVLSPSGPFFNETSMLYNSFTNAGLTPSISYFEPNGDLVPDKKTAIEQKKPILDYSSFDEYVLSSVSIKIESLTTIDIDSYSELKVMYRSGLLEDLKKDPTFDIKRGDEVTASNQSYFNKPIGEFVGNNEQILLYKAFVQAGDNYKSVVLPYIDVKSESPVIGTIASEPTQPVKKPDTQEYTFNVEKKDTFIVVGGTVSPPLELVIVPNDGTKYIFEEPKQLGTTDELSDEYTEGEFLGNEEDIWAPPPPEGYPSIDTDTLNSLKGVDPENPGDLTTDSNNKYPTSKDKDANIKELIKQAKKAGVTNKYAIVAILAIISKESGFIPKSEFSYRNTSGARCVKIFGRRGLTDQQWDELRKDDVKFFNFIYGNKYGNGPSDGYKYRGRGLNQITFKAIYEKYGKATGYDIVSDPDLLNTITVAAACAVEYFKTGINGAPSSIKKQYNFTNINSFSNLNDATGAIYHCNAGFGHSYASIVADSTGGRKKAFNNAGPLYNSYSDQIA